MKLKELESRLSSIETFVKPKVNLEQYQTSAHLASRILFSAESTYESFSNKTVMDFGCGSGIFTAGPLLLGANFTWGLDIDPEALVVCKNNLQQVVGNCDEDDVDQGCQWDLIQADITKISNPSSSSCLMDSFKKSVDTVIMNPPFGTKNNKGIDMIFLKTALDFAQDTVYSLHKTSTRQVYSHSCSLSSGDASFKFYWLHLFTSDHHCVTCECSACVLYSCNMMIMGFSDQEEKKRDPYSCLILPTFV